MPTSVFAVERAFRAGVYGKFDVYINAFYYDIVFARDVTSEIDVVEEVYRQCVGGRPRSMIDLACGPGYHARAAAKRGMRAVGLDLHEQMVAFAADRATEDGVIVEWIAADMRDMQLSQPVDVALNVFDASTRLSMPIWWRISKPWPT
jgi:SAM-dependent methyltransferase